MPGERSYAAFISYARADATLAQWLSRFLEGLWIADPRPRRPFKRVFRDVDEMGAAQELGAALREKLDQSDRLIILASATSLKSRWVTEEIQYFNSKHPDRPIFTMVVGEPGLRGQSVRAWAATMLGSDQAQQHPLLVNAEPASPDIETEGRLVAARRLAAGMLNVSYDALAGRRARASMIIAGAAALVVGVVGGAAFFGQPALATWRAMEDQRAAENAFIEELSSKADDEQEAANMFACCASLVARAPADVRAQLESTVRASGALSGPISLERQSLVGYNSIIAIDDDRIVASGGSGFRVIGTQGEDLLSGVGNVSGVGWDLPSNQLFVVSPDFNFRGARVLRFDLSGNGSQRGEAVVPQNVNFDLGANTVRILAVSGAYGYFLDEASWRLLRLDMRNGASVVGNAGQPTRATASPNGRFVLVSGSAPGADDNLLIDMGTSRSIPDVDGVMTNFGLIAGDTVFRFDTWSWAPVVARGPGEAQGTEGLIVENHFSVSDPVATTGIVQVRCPSGQAECEKMTVFSAPYIADGYTASVSGEGRLTSVIQGIYDLTTGDRLFGFQAATPHMFVRNGGRSILGVAHDGELVRWDLDDSTRLPVDQFQQRLCLTLIGPSPATIGTRTFSCEQR